MADSRKTITVDDIPELKRYIDAIIKNRGAVLQSGANTFLADIKNRVFKFGLDAQGAAIGGYSEGWARVRRSRGRQTSYVDLKFTGSLDKNLGLGIINKDKLVVGFSSEDESDKRKTNELRFKGATDTIFIASEQEAEAVEKAMYEVINRILNDADKN